MRALSTAVAVVLGACGDDGVGTSPDAADKGEDIAAIPPGCASERATADRPDDHGFDQIRVLYVVPADGVDASHDTSGKICNSIRAIATWFSGQASAYLRFDTTGGLVDIGFVRLTRTDAELRGTDPDNASIETGTAFVRERIERELSRMGMIAENKLYAVYYEGSSSWACGGGAYPPLIVARVGAMYLGGIPLGQTQPCGETRPWGQPSLVPSYIDYGMLHEVVHSMGIVSMTAPHQHATGHVFDVGAADPGRDLMYSPRVGQQDPGWAIDHPGGLVLDIGNDDYFQANTGVELSLLSLVAPLPANARRPIGWN